MQVSGIRTLSYIRDHYTSQHSHANLTDTNTRHFPLEQPLQDLFQRKKDEMFKDIQNVFGIADILVVGYDSTGRDHDNTFQRVLQTHRQVNLKLKEKCHFKNTSLPCLER